MTIPLILKIVIVEKGVKVHDKYHSSVHLISDNKVYTLMPTYKTFADALRVGKLISERGFTIVPFTNTVRNNCWWSTLVSFEKTVNCAKRHNGFMIELPFPN